MRRYLAQRLLLMIPTLLLVSVMVFAIMRLIPGDVVSLMFQDLGYAQSLAEMRARLGLDLPVHEQDLPGHHVAVRRTQIEYRTHQILRIDSAFQDSRLDGLRVRGTLYAAGPGDGWGG